MLYNEKQKLQFIESFAKSDIVSRQVYNIFSRIGLVEEKYGSDMCFIDDRDAMLEIVGCVSSNRATSTLKKIRMLQRYVEWCAERFEGVSKLVDEIGFEDVNSGYIMNHMVADPSDLVVYLDSFLRKDDDHTIDIVYKSVLWLAFAGLDEELINNIRIGNIDLEITGNKFYINYEGRSYPVPVEAHHTLELCVTLTEFVYTHPCYGNDIVRSRVGGDILLRGVKAAADSYKLLTQTVAKKAKLAGITRRVNYTGAKWSGFFYRLHQQESKGMIDFQDEARRFIGDKEYKLDNSRLTQSGMRNRVAKELQADYLLWKKVFKKN